MTTLIPSYSICVSRMTAGERRFAQRLEAKLEDDYLCWHDVPVGQSLRHPDFRLCLVAQRLFSNTGLWH
ncbi:MULTISPECIES: hypothetical protein [Nitrosomonas]|nr:MULTISPECIES: hypothetical protein [Nitrosomonas]UVS62998.1 hypothetical protein NX761_07870 [Nitrosomonas sp. PLL12]